MAKAKKKKPKKATAKKKKVAKTRKTVVKKWAKKPSVHCTAFINDLLEKRFQDVLSGKLDHKNIHDLASIRGLFYSWQRLWKNTNPYGQDQFDFYTEEKIGKVPTGFWLLLNPSKKVYHDRFATIIKNFSKAKMKELSKIPLADLKTMYPDFKYWSKKLFVHYNVIRRNCLSIQPKQRAISYGYSGDFPVLPKNIHKLVNEALILIICEKEDVGLKVLDKLNTSGYDANMVSSQGFSVGDLIESIIDISEKRDNFYVLMLHDLDYSGISIYLDVKKYFPTNCFSIGLNYDMLKWTVNDDPSFDPTISMESYKNTGNRKHNESTSETKSWIVGINRDFYDFDSNRIELVELLVPQIVKYTKYLINTLPKFNINRIKWDIGTDFKILDETWEVSKVAYDMADLGKELLVGDSLAEIEEQVENVKAELRRRYRHYHKKPLADWREDRDLVSDVLQKMIDDDNTVKFLRSKSDKMIELMTMLLNEGKARMEILIGFSNMNGLIIGKIQKKNNDDEDEDGYTTVFHT